MSQEEAIDKGLRLIPTWAPILWVVISSVFASGITFAGIQGGIHEMRQKVERIEVERKEDRAYVLQILERMDTKLDGVVQRTSRIEGALNK